MGFMAQCAVKLISYICEKSFNLKKSGKKWKNKHFAVKNCILINFIENTVIFFALKCEKSVICCFEATFCIYMSNDWEIPPIRYP